jgi:chloramphenicol-sensitive protein RarD
MNTPSTSSGSSHNAHLLGTLYALAAFIAWGLLPAYWKLLQQVASPEILAHRIFWSFVFVSVILLAKGRWKTLLHPLADKQQRLGILISTVLISANWFIYIWAVNSAHIVEASLGYYINPLFCVFLGVVVFKERLRFWEILSIGLAALGVIFLAFQYGRVPWIAISLTFTFGFYGLSKKLVQVGSLAALGLETLLVSPLCLLYMGIRAYHGHSAFGVVSWSVTLLLVLAGVVTALPLLWFAQSAKLIPLSRVGFIQYLAPSIALLLGVFVYGEPFTPTHAISFGCIWTALLIYSCSQMPFFKKIHGRFQAS